MGTLLQDVRYAFRILLKTPGFVIVTVLTLALGIGANTALFSIVNAVLLNPLPFPDSHQLVTFYESKPHFQKGSFSYLDFQDLEKASQSFSSMAAYRTVEYAMTSPGDPVNVRGEMITARLFSMIGVKPVIGRDFRVDEDRQNAEAVVLLDQDFWQKQFGSSRDILNRVVTLDGRNFTVVGVVPHDLGLEVQNFHGRRDVYVLMGQNSDPEFFKRSASWGTDGIARMKPGVSIEQARAELNTEVKRISADYPDSHADVGATVVPIKDEIVGNVRPTLLILLGAVGLVLLIACVNVANLMLVRATGRSREFSIRVALGASQTRIVRQLLTESVVLGLAGGALGVLLASWGIQAGLRMVPEALPRTEHVGIDSHVLLFTLLISLLAGVLFGLAPALRMSQSRTHDTLKEGSRGSQGRRRTQSVFVAVEMALALVLLVSAGLMLRTLKSLWDINPGFSAKNVLYFETAVPLPSSSPTPEMLRAGLQRIRENLKSIPAVDSFALTWGATPMNSDDEEQFWVEGRPKPADASGQQWALQYIVEPEYFRTMQIDLKQGRLLTTADDERSRPVIVVDEKLARQYFPGESAVGKYLNLIGYKKKVEIVGVVNHVKQFGLSADDLNSLQAQIYVPLAQSVDQPYTGASLGARVYLRSSVPPLEMSERIRRTLQGAGTQEIIASAEPMQYFVEKSVANQRFLMSLLGGFAAIALALATIGIYGVASYLVGQRTREIGIRMALGAQQSDVLRLIMGSGLRMALVGVAIGFVASLAATRLLINMLYGVKPFDPLTFVCVVAVLSAVTMLACYAPARRASKVEPLVALRYE